MFITHFAHVLPPFFKTQSDSFQWVANLYSAAQQNQKYSVTDYKKLLARVGCPEDQIQIRRSFLQDFNEDSFDKMKIYNVKESKSGAGALVRQEVFQNIAEKVFHEIYETRDLPSDLIHVSCTGYVSPSAAQMIASSKGALSTTITHAYHMGCYGAFPALRMAAGFLSAPKILGKKNNVDIVHTELCTLHSHPQDPTLEQMVIQSLFADGCIAYSVQNEKPKMGFEILAIQEIQIPNSDKAMQWVVADGGMKMVLTKDVPSIIGCNIRKAVQDFLGHQTFDFAAIHPGGPKIIDLVKQELNLTENQIQWSKKVLSERGNMSSATLPHIWQEMQNDNQIENEKLILSMAFGPGLTLCLSLMRKIL